MYTKIEGIAVIGAARFRHHVVAYVMRERLWVNSVGSSSYWTKPRLCCKPFAELPPLHFRAVTGWLSVVVVGEDRSRGESVAPGFLFCNLCVYLYSELNENVYCRLNFCL